MKIRILSFTFILINALTNPLIAYLQHQYIGQETKLTRNLTRNKLDRTLFNYPIDLIFYKTGSQKVLFVSDATWCRIVYNDLNEYTSEEDSIRIRAYGGYGTGTYSLKKPQGLSMGDYNLLYVADTGNNRIVILKYTPSQKKVSFKAILGSPVLNKPYDVKYYAGKIYVADTYNHRIVRFASDGTVEATFGSYGSGHGQFDEPWSIDKSDNYIYVVDKKNKRVVILFEDDNGDISYYSERDITQYGSRTLAVELSVDTYGNVYILDENKCRILKFTPRMEELLWIYGSEGYGVNQLKWPRGLSTPYGYGDVGVVEYWTDYSGIRAYYTVISILSFTASKESFDASEDTGYTDISFKIDDVAEVSVVVLDSLGQTVKTLIDNITFPAGTSNNVCTWDGEDDEGRLVLPGNYTIKMTAVDGYGNQDVKTISIRIKGRLIQKIATINI